MEALILYFVLFFPGIYSSGISAAAEAVETIPFSILRELGRTLTYTLPSIALIWYIIYIRKDYVSLPGKPKKNDFISFFAGLGGLIVISLCISLLVSLLSLYIDLPVLPKIEAPLNPAAWVVMVFSCFGTGYLEESYFRYYIHTKYEDTLQAPVRAVLSTFLFSLCHIYEGPAGFINSVLAGILLSVLFIRFRALHGLAWAHGAYNVFVYAMGIFGS